MAAKAIHVSRQLLIAVVVTAFAIANRGSLGPLFILARLCMLVSCIG